MLNELLGELSLEAQVRVAMDDQLGALLARAGTSLMRQRDEMERLRASIGAIHCRVAHGQQAGALRAVLDECEQAIPELVALLPNT